MNYNCSLPIHLLVLLSLCIVLVLGELGNWKMGRATYYGNEYWLWDIHQGSCGYGYLCPEEGTGWDVAALPDKHPMYAGSCGRCFEVKCSPTNFKDNYGETLSRASVCYDPQASIVVMVTDTCPCYYPANLYSNARWCCGDMDHLDLSIWAFEKLAEPRWGVIGLSYREVPCNHQPYRQAAQPASPFPPTPVPEGTVCPKNRFHKKEKWEIIHMLYKNRIISEGLTPYESAGDFEAQYYAILSGAEPANRESEEVVFSETYENGWRQTAWNTHYYESNLYGVDGRNAMCGDFSLNSGLEFNGPMGVFEGKGALEFWVLTRGWGVPHMDITFTGPDGQCEPLHLSDLFPAEERNGYTRFVVNLNIFSIGGDLELRMLNSYGKRFYNCGFVQAKRLTTISIRNTMHYAQTVCFDEVRFVAP